LDNLDVKRELRAKYAFPAQSERARLLECRVNMLDGQRVFVADIENAVRGARCVGANQHALQDAVRVALEHAAVHVGSRVAFIGVAYEVFAMCAGLLCQQFPFKARGKTRAAAPPKP